MLQFDVPAERRSAGTARKTIQAWLLERDFPKARLDDWLVVVSELVTNAALHAKTEARVVVRWNGQRVLLEVCDRSPSVPAVPEGPAVGGRGLFMVERLTTAWGFEPASDGKRVWAELGGLEQ